MSKKEIEFVTIEGIEALLESDLPVELKEAGLLRVLTSMLVDAASNLKDPEEPEKVEPRDTDLKLDFSSKLKEVEYLGTQIKVSKAVSYLATDECGDIWGFEFKPLASNDKWCISEANLGFCSEIVDLGEKFPDWKDSLREV